MGESFHDPCDCGAVWKRVDVVKLKRAIEVREAFSEAFHEAEDHRLWTMDTVRSAEDAWGVETEAFGRSVRRPRTNRAETTRCYLLLADALESNPNGRK